MRVVLADDHRIVRDGLKLILAHDPEVDVVAEVDDGVELLEVLKTAEADMVLLDLKMPGLSGLEVLEQLRADGSTVKVIILSMHDDAIYVKRAIELGACGYLLKSVSREELSKALHVVAGGGSYVQGEIAGPLVAHIMCGEGRRAATELGVEDRRLLELLATGCRNDAIAVAMGLSESAVKARLHALYARLEVSGRSGAVAVAIRMGLVQ